MSPSRGRRGFLERAGLRPMDELAREDPPPSVWRWLLWKITGY